MKGAAMVQRQDYIVNPAVLVKENAGRGNSDDRVGGRADNVEAKTGFCLVEETEPGFF